jgi:hypothetical protein
MTLSAQETLCPTDFLLLCVFAAMGMCLMSHCLATMGVWGEGHTHGDSKAIS